MNTTGLEVKKKKILKKFRTVGGDLVGGVEEIINK